MNRETFVSYKERAVAAPTREHMDPGAFERLLASVEWQADHFEEIPALIIACLEFDREPPDRFAAGAGAGGSIWPGVQNLLLAARALGLGATPTTFALADKRRAKQVLGLPATIEPFCLIPVGYPMGNFGPVRRRPVSGVLRWDRWS
jgi:nitroreductase